MFITTDEPRDDVADPVPCFASAVPLALQIKLGYLIEALELEDLAIVKGAEDGIGHQKDEKLRCL